MKRVCHSTVWFFVVLFLALAKGNPFDFFFGNSEAETLKQEVSNLRDQLFKAGSEIEALKGECGWKDQKINKCNSLLYEKENALISCKHSENSKSEEIERLKMEKTDISNKLACQGKLLEQQRTVNSKFLENQIANTTSVLNYKIQFLERQLANETAKVDLLQDQVDTLEDEVLHFSKSNQKMESELNTCENKLVINYCNSTQITESREYTSLQSQHDETMARIKALQDWWATKQILYILAVSILFCSTLAGFCL